MAEEKVRSQVEDINRSIYDVKDKVEFSYKAETGVRNAAHASGLCTHRTRSSRNS